MNVHSIASYIPEKRRRNHDLMEKFNISRDFIDEKLGFEEVSLKAGNEETSDLCVKAFEALKRKIDFDEREIEIIVLVTQNPDRKIPHTSAIIHSKLNLGGQCASYDISQGCAGYVFGLANIVSFMKMAGLKKGLLFTCDPYSKVVSEEDKNTSLLFGDAATVTYLAPDGSYELEGLNFGIQPHSTEHLCCNNDEPLYMNGREVFNFAMKEIPPAIEALLDSKKLKREEIDKVIAHQGSKYLVDNLRKRLRLSENQLAFQASKTGNTVSSSIPLILENLLGEGNRFLLSGFGVGLSWGNLLLRKV